MSELKPLYSVEETLRIQTVKLNQQLNKLLEQNTQIIELTSERNELLNKVSKLEVCGDAAVARINELTAERDNALAQNAELVAMVEALRIAALNAIQRMPGGEAKADLRDAYDATPAQHLRDRDAEVGRAGHFTGYMLGYEHAMTNKEKCEPAVYAQQYAEKVRRGEV